jgi:sugar phosphate isomerase/epimerase
MKLSVTTLGCPEWSFPKILDEAQKVGFSAIEIRGIEDKMLAEEIVQFFPENREATLGALKAHGLEIVCFGGSVSFHLADQFDEMVARGKRTIDICQFMGIPLVRIFGDRFPPNERESDVIARVAKGAGILAEYGKEKKVMVLLETHGDFNTLERVKGVFDQAENGNLRLLWDVAHTDCIYADNFLEFYRPMKEFIVHTHFKDHIRGRPGDEKTYKLCRFGEGQIPIAAIVSQLLSDGYNGYFCFEWEKKWHPELPGAEIAYPDFVRVMNEIN